VTECNREDFAAVLSLTPWMAAARQEINMLASHGTVQEVENAKLALALVAVAIVAFWRAIIRVLLAVIVIAVVVSVGAGAIALLQGVHR
jgi:type IV secretory pathway VirB6-like protein